MLRRHTVSLVLIATFAFASRVDAQSGATNLGLDSFGVQLHGKLVAFQVPEALQGGLDRNGDGDASDQVPSVYDASTGVTTNIGIAVRSGSFALADERYVVIPADDGLHVYDSVTGLTAHYGIVSSGGMTFRDGRLGFRASEAAVATDLNGDGDTLDGVAGVLDVASGQVTNLGLALSASPPDVDGDLVALIVAESSQGNSDRNGDGDAADFVIAVHSLSTGVTRNLGLAALGAVVKSPLVAFAVRESMQGNQDLNGDGSAALEDEVVHVYDWNSNTAKNLGLAAGSSLFFEGGLLAFCVDEVTQGHGDLNGDGDVVNDERVVFAYDTATDVTTDVGLAAAVFGDVIANDGKHLAFQTIEAQQGHADLNGDGDATDLVLHTWTRGGAAAVNLHLASTDFRYRGDGIVGFLVDEVGQGDLDLNGDHDTFQFDEVLHVCDLDTGIVRNIGRAVALVGSFGSSGTRVGYAVYEHDQGGIDLNGDGDVFDQVLEVFELQTGARTSLGLDGGAVNFDGKLLATLVSESNQGGLDLNGDGNTTSDLVVHVWKDSATPIVYCTAKTNSKGCLPAIAATDSSDLTDVSPFFVSANSLLNRKYALFLYGLAGSNAQPFQGGWLCVRAPLSRTPVIPTGGTATGIDCTGTARLDFKAFAHGGFDPALDVGATVWMQCYSRDPGAIGGSSTTDAVSFVLGP